jgi:hypothetical protein
MFPPEISRRFNVSILRFIPEKFHRLLASLFHPLHRSTLCSQRQHLDESDPGAVFAVVGLDEQRGELATL